TAVFYDHIDIYFARQQVSERLLEARDSLPPGAEPTMGPITSGLGEIYMWTVDYEHRDGQGANVRDGRPGWQSDGTYLTLEGEVLQTDVELGSYLRTVQDWIIRPQLKDVEGVAGVDSIGGYVKQYHVQPDPMKLVAYGLTFHDVIEALERNNVSTGAGYIEHAGEYYTVRAVGRIHNKEQIAKIVVGGRPGTPIYVRDIAIVKIGKELRTGSASEDGKEVVVGTAMMLIGANSRTVSIAVDEKIAEIRKTLPPDIQIKTVLNRTKLVDATIRTVEKNLTEGAILVIVVLLLLVGNFRAAVITSLAIPLAMLLAVTGMVQAGVSGNLMSLGAIDFGLIVDGSVIIVENCLRVLAEKQHQLGRPLTAKERLEVVYSASKQVRTATAFGEIIIMIVYVPILALTGIEGKMFHPMAITVIFALGAAFVLSLTFIPAMVAIGITGKVKHTESILIRLAKRAYEPAVRFAVRRRYAIVLLAILPFAGSLMLASRLGQEFIPTLDEKDLITHAMRIPSISLTQASEMQFAVERTISRFPEVAYVFSKTGTAEMAADPMPPNVSDTFIILEPREDWPDPSETKEQLRQRIEDALQQLPGNKYEFMQPIQMRFSELIAGVRSDLAFKIFGDDFDLMLPVAQAAAKVLEGVRGSADVTVEQITGLPMMTIRVDRDAIARYGLSVEDVQEVVTIAIGGREAGLVFEGDRRFEIVVRLPEEVRQDIDALKDLPIPLPFIEPGLLAHGASSFRRATDTAQRAAARARPFVSLGEVADIELSEGPNQISRENGKRRIVVQANVRGRDIGSFVEEAQREMDRQVVIPAGYWVEWGGQFENLVAARKRLTLVVPICLLMVFMLLFTTFNSAKQAFMVFTGVPLALTGGIFSLWIRDMPLSISAAVGFIALSGVAVLNGLVMVTFINQLRAEGAPLEDAIIRGSLTRLRPVLMTALVASLGFVPMALASGTGAEVQRPLATVVIGGLISSTLLTLLVIPAVYRIFEHSKPTQAHAA
ncbi:MAG: CusA/CzcA family heavy metal efflux RND transporter, partial [Planctomycetes bacterium]|nr:CusA/CzcA family heavy metal efflux RND transporter [Planctomycetota bacterium]